MQHSRNLKAHLADLPRQGYPTVQPYKKQALLPSGGCRETAPIIVLPQHITVMSHYFIDRQDPRVADLLRRLGNIGQALGQVESVARPMFKGDRFLTDEELSRLLKVSRRTLQEYRTARLIPYYIVQGKALYRESEIQSLLEKAHRKCVEEQKWL